MSLAEVQHQQQASSKQIRRLEHLAQDCEAIPGLKKDLAAAKQRGDRLQSERDALQVRSCVPIRPCCKIKLSFSACYVFEHAQSGRLSD